MINKKNAFDVEEYMRHQLNIGMEDEFSLIEVDADVQDVESGEEQ